MSKILLVEDDALTLRLYQQAFSFDEECEVDIAENGLQGLEKVRIFKPDVILLDVMMPEMNGLEVLDKLKENEETKKIPVVMLTNISNSDNVQAALEKGAVKYIVKSEYRPKEIVNMVKEVLEGYTRYNVPRARGH